MGRGMEMVGDFFTKMDEGGEKGEGLRERYSCDSCEQFSGRGNMNWAAFKLLLYLTIIYIIIYIMLPLKRRGGRR